MKSLIERLQDPELYVDAIDEAVDRIKALEADLEEARKWAHEYRVEAAHAHEENHKLLKELSDFKEAK